MKICARVSTGTVALYVPVGRGVRVLNHATIVAAGTRLALITRKAGMDPVTVVGVGEVGRDRVEEPHPVRNTDAKRREASWPRGTAGC
jgi:hypothetical protein